VGGKQSAAYYRAYRASHPELKERYNELRRKRRAEQGRGDRSAEYRSRARRKAASSGDNGCCLESCIVKKAKQLAESVKRPDRRTVLWDDRYEDLVGICILALCEGRDPKAAMRSWLKEEWYYHFYRMPLLDV
jgi:hypothetical protein